MMSFSKQQLLRVEKMGEEEQKKFIESLKISEMNLQTLLHFRECIRCLSDPRFSRPIFTEMLVQQKILYQQQLRPTMELLRAQELAQLKQRQQQQKEKKEEPQKQKDGFFAKLCSLFKHNHQTCHSFNALKTQAEDQQLNTLKGIRGQNSQSSISPLKKKR